MKDIRAFHIVTIGQSHIKKNMPCQDAAGSYEDIEKGIFISAVSDGHGGKDYFRSDKGSQLVVDITIEKLKLFVEELNSTLFQEDFITRGTLTSINKQFSSGSDKTEQFEYKDTHEKKKNEEVLNHLFKSIISKWNEEVHNDWKSNKPTEEFLIEKAVPEDRRSEYLRDESIEMAYGCTLLAFLKTPEFWVAFQIGDGRCIAFDAKMNDFIPIPEDEQCEGNLTTSLCESNAFDNFRYAYGKKELVALFIGSDGLEGRHGDLDFYTIPQVTKDYRAITKVFLNNGFDYGFDKVKEAIPAWSKNDQNAKDDISVAGWIDFSNKEECLKILLEKDIQEIKKKLDEADYQIKKDSEELKEVTNSIDEKINKINSIIQKEESLDSEEGQINNVIKEIENKLNKEFDKIAQIKEERDPITKQKEKLEAELNELNRIKENKIRIIDIAKAEIEKNKSILDKYSLENNYSDNKHNYQDDNVNQNEVEKPIADNKHDKNIDTNNIENNVSIEKKKPLEWLNPFGKKNDKNTE